MRYKVHWYGPISPRCLSTCVWRFQYIKHYRAWDTMFACRDPSHQGASAPVARVSTHPLWFLGIFETFMYCRSICFNVKLSRLLWDWGWSFWASSFTYWDHLGTCETYVELYWSFQYFGDLQLIPRSRRLDGTIWPADGIPSLSWFWLSQMHKVGFILKLAFNVSLFVENILVIIIEQRKMKTMGKSWVLAGDSLSPE